MIIMKRLRLLSALSLAAVITSCSTSIEQPKGTSQGYNTARLIERNLDADVTDDAVAMAKEEKIHGMIQKAIQHEFTNHGLNYGKSGADLKVAYLVMIQNNAITFHYNDYFGKGRDADALAEYAHLRGVTKGTRDEFFERVIIVVDVLDAKTDKLIFRNHYVNDIVDVPSDAVRRKRVQAAIKGTLSSFFKK